MKFIALPFVLLAGVAGSLGQSDFTVSVADHTQCASTEITWENGVGECSSKVYFWHVELFLMVTTGHPKWSVSAFSILVPLLLTEPPPSDSAWIESDGAAVPVIDTGSLEVTSYPLVNDAAAGT
ncbi:hypothetical protein LXA43DRAFT_1094095 [Ganoderma leucocontextum]|nr:hypothetical protein LXA43DRAFT_1094095 [Ganoderma leucocontextum]